MDFYYRPPQANATDDHYDYYDDGTNGLWKWERPSCLRVTRLLYLLTHLICVYVAILGFTLYFAGYTSLEIVATKDGAVFFVGYLYLTLFWVLLDFWFNLTFSYKLTFTDRDIRVFGIWWKVLIYSIVLDLIICAIIVYYHMDPKSSEQKCSTRNTACLKLLGTLGIAPVCRISSLILTWLNFKDSKEIKRVLHIHYD